MSQKITAASTSSIAAMTMAAGSARLVCVPSMFTLPLRILDASLRLYETDRLEHVVDARLFLFQELGERVGGKIGVVPAFLLEDVLPRGGLRHLVDGIAQRLRLRRRD